MTEGLQKSRFDSLLETTPRGDSQAIHLAARGNLWEGVLLRLIKSGIVQFSEVYAIANQITQQEVAGGTTVELSRRMNVPEELRKGIVEQVGRIQPASLHLRWEREVKP